jgi:choline dehydrogenase
MYLPLLFFIAHQIGGTAGCVLASRLSDDSKTSVLLLESGPANDTWASRVPLMSGNIHDPSTGAVNWLCEPMRNCEDRQIPVFRGEALGGTSRVNALLYTRGAAADYDAWSFLGHPEWSYKNVLQYFVKSETTLSNAKATYRGTSGMSFIRTWVRLGVLI